MPTPPSRFSRWLALACAWWVLIVGGAVGSLRGADTATHVVRAGDTIPRLCWQYKVRTAAILRANPGIGDPLVPGRRLAIPLGTYTARPGPALASPRRTTVTTAKVTVKSAATAKPVKSRVIAPARPALPAAEPLAGPPRLQPTTRLPPVPRATPSPAVEPVTVVSVPLRKATTR